MVQITKKRIWAFLHFDFSHKLLLMEALLLLGLSRAALLIMDFREIAPRLGTQRELKDLVAETGGLVDEGQKKLNARAKGVGWAVRAMSRYTPWESKCLVQAMAAKIMLNRRKISNTLYLGVAKDNTGAMVAHAWIKCGSFILTGEREAERFTVVAAFSS